MGRVMLVGRELEAGDRPGGQRAARQRTSLLSLGDDDCRFAVLETDDPLAGYADALDQRFVERPVFG
jgi:hypothetical protein